MNVSLEEGPGRSSDTVAWTSPFGSESVSLQSDGFSTTPIKTWEGVQLVLFEDKYQGDSVATKKESCVIADCKWEWATCWASKIGNVRRGARLSFWLSGCYK